IIVRAVDAAGNANETTITVERVAVRDGGGVAAPGPDWPFVAFIIASVSFVTLEALVSCRWLRRRGAKGR
ncbi:MAG: hypothetical protein QXD84_09805, partial [Thermoplasmata archaeon]